MKTTGRILLGPASAAKGDSVLSAQSTKRSALRRLIEYLCGRKNTQAAQKPTLLPFLHRCIALPCDGDFSDWRERLNPRHLNENAVYFYLADADGKVCGRLPLHVFFHNPHPEDIWAECELDLVVVPLDTNPIRLWHFMRRYRHSELPVCDAREKFLGIIYRAVLARHILKKFFSHHLPPENNAKRSAFFSRTHPLLRMPKKFPQLSSKHPQTTPTMKTMR